MRVKIKPGSQQQFLETIRQILHWSWVDLANHCGVALRTFSNWYEEHYNAPYEVFQSLSNLAGVPLPEFEEIMTEHEWRSRRSRAAYRSRWGRAGVGNGGRPQQGRQNCTKAAA